MKPRLLRGTRWSPSFIHRGDLFGVPTTGKREKQNGIMIYRIKVGKVVEVWVETNMLAIERGLRITGLADTFWNYATAP